MSLTHVMGSFDQLHYTYSAAHKCYSLVEHIKYFHGEAKASFD